MTFTIITRSLIIYSIALFLIRIMGKRQLGEMQPFELVITLIIADLACIPMADTALPLVHGIIPIIVLTCIHYFLSLLERKSLRLRKLLNGKSIILISPNGIEYNNLKDLNMNFNDLQDALRTSGFFKLEDVLYAIMQTNGVLTVLPRTAPVTPSDLNIKTEPASLPVIVLAEGKFVKENVSFAKVNEQFILDQVNKAGYKTVKDIIIATINNEGKMYIQGKKGKFIIHNTDFTGSW